MKKIFLAAVLLSCGNKLNLNNISKADEEKAARANKIKGRSWQSVLMSSDESSSDEWCKNFLLLINSGTITVNSIKQLEPIIEDIITNNSNEVEFIRDVIQGSLRKANDLAKYQLLQLFNKTVSHEMQFNILHYASKFLTSEFVELLLKLRMDVNLAAKEGITPLMSAAGRVDEDGEKVVEALLKAGADKRMKNNFDKTALDIATSHKILDLLSQE